MSNQKSPDSPRCYFGHYDPAEYLVFIDGAAEQLVCLGCARDIEKRPFGMTAYIDKVGSKAVEDYLKDNND